jgi:hypothetical protein
MEIEPVKVGEVAPGRPFDTDFCNLVLSRSDLFLRPKGRIEGNPRGAEINLLGELAGFFRALFTIHSAVFPLYRKRAAVANLVQLADDGFEVNAAVAERTKVPAAVWVAEIQVGA